MVCHFNATRMLYYNKIVIFVELTQIMGIFVSEIELIKWKINKHFIQLPANDGVDEYTSLFRQM